VVNEKDPLIVFMPSGKRGRFSRGTPVLEAARSLGVDIDSVCGGRAICGRCQVEVAEGDFAKHGINSLAANVTPCGESEDKYRERRGLGDARRLSCQAKLEADVVIDVPASSQVHHQVIRKPHEDHDITSTKHWVISSAWSARSHRIGTWMCRAASRPWSAVSSRRWPLRSDR
jgi:uncharacterized 2Fe-2S/4Fe-4S cluster protein (DUF4445 family)